MKSPGIIKNIFSKEDFDNLKSYLLKNYKEYDYDLGFGRYTIGHKNILNFETYIKIVEKKAQDFFESKTLKHTYSLFSHYEGNASLYKHKDDNACTYTLDLCMYQNEPWDLWVEGTPYCLKPNQALAYYGNSQLHWREDFPNPDSQHVAMIFFHFAEPDHWFFTKGPSYLGVIRNEITEEQWIQEKAQH